MFFALAGWSDKCMECWMHVCWCNAQIRNWLIVERWMLKSNFHESCWTQGGSLTVVPHWCYWRYHNKNMAAVYTHFLLAHLFALTAPFLDTGRNVQHERSNERATWTFKWTRNMNVQMNAQHERSNERATWTFKWTCNMNIQMNVQMNVPQERKKSKFLRPALKPVYHFWKHDVLNSAQAILKTPVP